MPSVFPLKTTVGTLFVVVPLVRFLCLLLLLPRPLPPLARPLPVRPADVVSLAPLGAGELLLAAVSGSLIVENEVLSGSLGFVAVWQLYGDPRFSELDHFSRAGLVKPRVLDPYPVANCELLGCGCFSGSSSIQPGQKCRLLDM
jgi:hypothetical protein